MSDTYYNPDVSDATPLPAAGSLPRNLLYSIAADIGGIGLPTTAAEGTLAAYRGGFLGKAIGYRNGQSEIPQSKIKSLALHPVRLLANMDRETYYGARKQYLDWVTARELQRNPGRYDCFHGWSSDSLRTLIVARQLGVPTLIEIPTWHRNKFRRKTFYTKSERDGADHWKSRLHISRQQMLTEYRLASLILVQSTMAAESFLAEGVDPHRIFVVARGVDPEKFRPATPPPIFRLIFVGALIKRKGIHHLLKAWHSLKLKDAELILVGTVHKEIEPYLKEYKTDSVKLPGFVPNVREKLESASAFVFTSECEGSAKATYEAAACALPQITTRESGDVVVDGVNGVVIPANDPDALAEAIRHFHANPEILPAMAAAARARILERFTWEHHRRRLLRAYATAMGIKR
jgi:glycosyltransferase involved in cell wall biosynthesis